MELNRQARSTRSDRSLIRLIHSLLIILEMQCEDYSRQGGTKKSHTQDYRGMVIL
jgi:hypothetical protein